MNDQLKERIAALTDHARNATQQMQTKEDHGNSSPNSETKDDVQNNTGGGKKHKPMLFFYSHPVLRKVFNKQVYSLTAIVDTTPRNFTEEYYKKHPGLLAEAGAELDYGLEDSPMLNLLDGARFDSHGLHQVDTRAQKEELDSIGLVNGTITLNGWEYAVHKKDKYHCCYEYADGSKAGAVMLKKHIWQCTFKILKAAQFVCPLVTNTNVQKGSEKLTVPVRVGLARQRPQACMREQVKYLPVEKAENGNEYSIAVCAKLIFDKYPSERLIEWMEFMKYMEVDKIMLFTFNVSQETQTILKFYRDQGLLIFKEFDYPVKSTFPRKPGGKNIAVFHDEQVTVFDCQTRFHGYGYLAVLDLDEFIVPIGMDRPSWKTMLQNFTASYPNAGGFSFHTQIFTLDWGPSHPQRDTFITRYTARTVTMWDRKKNIVLPARVQRGSVWTHDYSSLPPYKDQRIPAAHAVIFHYRGCRRHWVHFNTCMKGRKRVYDKTMVRIVQEIELDIMAAKKKLLPNFENQTIAIGG